MYYKRALPVASGVYRPLETRRYLMMSLGGYWPVIQKLPNGHLGVVTRDGDVHVGERSRVVFVTSPDGGESWSQDVVISDTGTVPALGVAPDGTLLAAFRMSDRFIEGGRTGRQRAHHINGPPGGYTPMWISRSTDYGATWGEAELVDGQGHEKWSHAGRTGPNDPHVQGTPFGKMLTLADGTMLMTYYLTTEGRPRQAQASFLIRSHDDGRTWVDCVTLAEGFYGEPTLCHLGDDRFLAILRTTTPEGGIASSYGQCLWQIDSEDGGHTWTEPRQITDDMESPGEVIRLQDGRLLLTYGRRVPPFGVQGMVSHDDGRTWDSDNRLLLVGDSGTYDCGYPGSVQRDDGTIVTVYYAWDRLSDNNQPQYVRLGVHAAALLYDAKDLP